MGATVPDRTTTLDIAFDAFGLDGGDYETAIRILTNIPEQPEVVVPVALHVDAAADIALIPGTYDFGNAFVGQSIDGAVEVRNYGTVPLTVSSIVS